MIEYFHSKNFTLLKSKHLFSILNKNNDVLLHYILSNFTNIKSYIRYTLKISNDDDLSTSSGIFNSVSSSSHNPLKGLNAFAIVFTLRFKHQTLCCHHLESATDLSYYSFPENVENRIVEDLMKWNPNYLEYFILHYHRVLSPLLNYIINKKKGITISYWIQLIKKTIVDSKKCYQKNKDSILYNMIHAINMLESKEIQRQYMETLSGVVPIVDYDKFIFIFNIYMHLYFYWKHF